MERPWVPSWWALDVKGRCAWHLHIGTHSPGFWACRELGVCDQRTGTTQPQQSFLNSLRNSRADGQKLERRKSWGEKGMVWQQEVGLQLQRPLLERRSDMCGLEKTVGMSTLVRSKA